MVQSGIGINDDCLEKYEQFKMRSKYKYILFAIQEDPREIAVIKAPETGTYDDFLKDLPSDSPCYGVISIEYELPDGNGKRGKIVFVSWMPNGTPVRQKMIYASSKDALKKRLTGLGREVHAGDLSDLEYESVLSVVMG